jgi:hypothetical protein
VYGSDDNNQVQLDTILYQGMESGTGRMHVTFNINKS